MKLSEDLNEWGEPVRPKSEAGKPRVVTEEADECINLDDLDITLRFLAESVDTELTPEQKRLELLEDTRTAKKVFEHKKTAFLEAMLHRGLSKEEALAVLEG